MRRRNTTKRMMKEYISQSLLLLMEKKNYLNISIAEITNKAGVNRSTYYRNFLSKEDIIKFYFQQIMVQYLEIYETLADKSFELYLLTLFEHFYRYKTHLLSIYSNGLSYLILEALNQFFKERNTQKPKSNQEMFRLCYHIGGIYNFFILWFSHGMLETPQELTDIAGSMFSKDKKPVLFE